MPGIASNTRSTRAGTGKVVKAPPAKARKTKKAEKAGSDDEYEPPHKETGGGEEVESQTFTALEQKVKDLKKKATSKNYAEAFNGTAKKKEDAIIDLLKQRQQKMRKASESNNMELAALIQEAIGDENPLRDFQASLKTMVNEVTDKHKPLQATLKSSLSNELVLGMHWPKDGEAAINKLSQYSSEGKKAIRELMEGTGEGGSDGDGPDGPWANKVKKSVLGLGKALSMVPIPRED